MVYIYSLYSQRYFFLYKNYKLKIVIKDMPKINMSIAGKQTMLIDENCLIRDF